MDRRKTVANPLEAEFPSGQIVWRKLFAIDSTFILAAIRIMLEQPRNYRFPTWHEYGLKPISVCGVNTLRPHHESWHPADVQEAVAHESNTVFFFLNRYSLYLFLSISTCRKFIDPGQCARFIGTAPFGRAGVGLR